MRIRPLARRDGVVTESLDDGLVLYDSGSHRAHRLDPLAARVWQAADGRHSVDELAEATGLPQASVLASLDQPEAHDLLVTAPGVSRRAALRRGVMIAAAALAAAPLIETVLIPTAAAHASTLGSNPGGSQTGSGNPVTGVNPTYIGWVYGSILFSFAFGVAVYDAGSSLVSVLQFPLGSTPSAAQQSVSLEGHSITLGGDSTGSFFVANTSGSNLYYPMTDPVLGQPLYKPLAPGGRLDEQVPAGGSVAVDLYA